MYLLIFVIGVGVAYLAFKIDKLLRMEAATAKSLENRLMELERKLERALPNLVDPCGWFDDGWPYRKSEEEDRAPLANPGPGDTADEFGEQLRITEYRSIQSPRERVNFLRSLRRASQTMEEKFLDIVYSDESPFVRAWAAAHLDLILGDYEGSFTDLGGATFVERRNYRKLLLSDAEPIVRAAVWSNPKNSDQLMIRVPDDWKEEFGRMSHLDRLGLMRHPDLSLVYVVALLETPSEDLKVSREEHAQVLCEAARNPGIVGSSRPTGRKFWGDYGEPPFEAYGKMWDLCLEWMDQEYVTYLFLKYVQTTPEKKLQVYNRLLKSGQTHLRKTVISSCDPLLDKAILKAAWGDPNEDCRSVAKERVGRYRKEVGV